MNNSYSVMYEKLKTLYAEKNSNYNDSFKKSIEDFGLKSVLTRVHNKTDRIYNLKDFKILTEQDLINMQDSIKDLMVYLIMIFNKGENVVENWPSYIDVMKSEVNEDESFNTYIHLCVCDFIYEVSSGEESEGRTLEQALHRCLIMYDKYQSVNRTEFTDMYKIHREALHKGYVRGLYDNYQFRDGVSQHTIRLYDKIVKLKNYNPNDKFENLNELLMDTLSYTWLILRKINCDGSRSTINQTSYPYILFRPDLIELFDRSVNSYANMVNEWTKKGYDLDKYINLCIKLYDIDVFNTGSKITINSGLIELTNLMVYLYIKNQ